MTIPHQSLAEEDESLALIREVNLDTQSSDSSAEETRESQRTSKQNKFISKIPKKMTSKTTLRCTLAKVLCQKLTSKAKQIANPNFGYFLINLVYRQFSFASDNINIRTHPMLICPVNIKIFSRYVFCFRVNTHTF